MPAGGPKPRLVCPTARLGLSSATKPVSRARGKKWEPLGDEPKRNEPNDPGNDAPNTGGVTSTDPNWGGPHPRHGGRSAIAFVDGHVDSLQPRKWFWSDTPWLKPDLGGQ